MLRSEDPAPAPWTEEVEARVEELGLRMVCSEGKQEEEEEEEKTYPKNVNRKDIGQNPIKLPKKKRSNTIRTISTYYIQVTYLYLRSTGYEPEMTIAALAITMFPELTDPSKLDKAGAESSDWKQSKPVRVIRSDKMRHSKYAQQKVTDTTGRTIRLQHNGPKRGKQGSKTKTIAALAITGYGYDGIYKPEGRSGSSTMDRRAGSEGRGSRPEDGVPRDQTGRQYEGEEEEAKILPT
ncbi:hypothetical protein L211DRAFT_853875 [Terfezia boudieri ATCC MYA-4762]|uniref:Uncharacterized protein n=1 Tax=Terfezia boudieri ATCC MYA-4762 TaxID=1051890 RepID=A0A3N4LDF9_9PEZI|nr:hypothetical protein L211DRAFT_853875 [Terfezia boudieri ATCC MYA-4762]